MRKLLNKIDALYWDNLPLKTLPFKVDFAHGAIYKHDVFYASFIALDCNDLRDMLSKQKESVK